MIEYIVELLTLTVQKLGTAMNATLALSTSITSRFRKKNIFYAMN